MNNLAKIVEKFKQNQVIAYPTEAVFGLGCNPQSEQAVNLLLNLKNRPKEKGLIVIASKIEWLEPYIDRTKLTEVEWQRLNQIQTQAITWLVPTHPHTPSFLTGKFNTLAVRLCQTPAVVALCEATQSAITSTSANLSGQPPCRTAEDVYAQFGNAFPVLQGETEGRHNPSEIRDIFSQSVFRNG